MLVCPGTYPEQLSIIRPVRLQGVTDGGGAVVIAVPPGGLVDNVTMYASGNHVAAQLALQNAVEAQLVNLIIDGTGIACATDFGVDRTAGIALNNVGNTGEWNRAVLMNLVVRRQMGGCLLSDGILRRIRGSSSLTATSTTSTAIPSARSAGRA